MIESTISVQKMLTVSAWSLAVALLLSAATVGLAAERWWIALLLAEAACVTSAMAATLTVRCYASKLAALMRATARSEEPSRVRSLH